MPHVSKRSIFWFIDQNTCSKSKTQAIRRWTCQCVSEAAQQLKDVYKYPGLQYPGKLLPSECSCSPSEQQYFHTQWAVKEPRAHSTRDSKCAGSIKHTLHLYTSSQSCEEHRVGSYCKSRFGSTQAFVQTCILQGREKKPKQNKMRQVLDYRLALQIYY